MRQIIESAVTIDSGQREADLLAAEQFLEEAARQNPSRANGRLYLPSSLDESIPHPSPGFMDGGSFLPSD
jgi:hypothetical protein